jgi:hypothetical protein
MAQQILSLDHHIFLIAMVQQILSLDHHIILIAMVQQILSLDHQQILSPECNLAKEVLISTII